MEADGGSNKRRKRDDEKNVNETEIISEMQPKVIDGETRRRGQLCPA